MPQEITDTHRRARLRGRAAVARARVTSGLWAARLLAIWNGITAVLALVAPGGPYWRWALGFVLLAVALVAASQRIQRGSRVGAAVLFALVLLGDLTQWFVAGRLGLFNIIVSLVVLAAIGNAIRGTFELHAIRNEAAHCRQETSVRTTPGTSRITSAP